MRAIAKTSSAIFFGLLVSCSRSGSPGSHSDHLKEWLSTCGGVTGAEITTVPIQDGQIPMPVRESPAEITDGLNGMVLKAAPEIKVAVRYRLVVHSKAGGDLQMNYLSDDSWSVGTDNYYKGPATPFSTE